MPTSREYARWRKRMVDEQLVKRGVNDRRVLDAMRVIPRHQFVPEEFKPQAYEDRPLPIGEGADDIPALHGRFHDGAPAPQAASYRAGDRHRLGLSDGDPLSFDALCLQRRGG